MISMEGNEMAKKLLINCASCDARKLQEENYSAYESNHLQIQTFQFLTWRIPLFSDFLIFLIHNTFQFIACIIFHFSTLEIIFLPVNYEIFYGIMGWLSALLFVLLYDT